MPWLKDACIIAMQSFHGVHTVYNLLYFCRGVCAHPFPVVRAAHVHQRGLFELYFEGRLATTSDNVIARQRHCRSTMELCEVF